MKDGMSNELRKNNSSEYLKITCVFCKKVLYIPPHGDREDAMRPHLSKCSGLAN